MEAQACYPPPMPNLIFILLISLAPLVSFSSSSKHESLISEIQKAWNQTKTYQADFEQTVLSKTLGAKEVTQGRMFVKKPLRLRWQTSDQKAVQILSGKEFWQIKSIRRGKQTQVDHYSDISRLGDLGALTFLADEIDIRKSYKYKVLTETSSQVTLALHSKTGGRETILAEILKPSYLLAALKLESVDSETRITFKNVQTDARLEDSLFQYQSKPQDTVHHHVR